MYKIEDMDFDLEKSIEILERTPAVLQALLSGLSDEWTMQNEGPDTWSPYDIIGHLIHGEKTDWTPRMQIILSDSPDKNFIPFDRFAQYNDSKGKSLQELLDEFGELRKKNIGLLRQQHISESDLKKTGIHPTFYAVTLEQLLSTWTVHDLNHIAQAVRVMAHQYKTAVGPWTAFLKILQ
jgi:hypothetical protein